MRADPERERVAVPPPGRAIHPAVKLGLLAFVLVILYFSVDAGIRWYVSSQIQQSKGAPMPAFRLTDRNGRTFSNDDLRGKTTVLNFFRSKCPRCREERDAIQRLAADADPARLQVLGVMMDRVVGYPEAMTQQTLAAFAYEHPILMADAAFADAFHGKGWAHVTPVTYIVDAKGRITGALRGHQTLETLRAATR